MNYHTLDVESIELHLQVRSERKIIFNLFLLFCMTVLTIKLKDQFSCIVKCTCEITQTSTAEVNSVMFSYLKFTVTQNY